MCGGITTLKHNVWTTLRLAYHERKNLTHTSKTRHAKRTQMVVTSRFTIRAFVDETVTRKCVRFIPEPLPESLHYRGFTFAHGDLTFWKFDKISTDYSVSHFTLEGILPVATEVFQTSLMLSLLKNGQNATITEWSKADQSSENN